MAAHSLKIYFCHTRFSFVKRFQRAQSFKAHGSHEELSLVPLRIKYEWLVVEWKGLVTRENQSDTNIWKLYSSEHVLLISAKSRGMKCQF